MFTPKKYKTGRITRSKARLHKTFPKKKHITRHKQDTIQGSIQDKKVYMTQQQNKTKTYIRETLNLLACAISSNKIPEKLKFYLGKSPVTYLLSPVTCHLWLFICHMSLMPTATVCWFAKTPKPFIFIFIYLFFFNLNGKMAKLSGGMHIYAICFFPRSLQSKPFGLNKQL